jgi:hypothetical protein
LQWLQNPSHRIRDSLSDVKRETSRTLRKKKTEYLKEKINELETTVRKNTRNSYRGVNEFKNCYRPRIKIVKHVNGDLLTDSNNIFRDGKMT